MSKIFRATDCDTGESEMELYEVPGGACLGLNLRADPKDWPPRISIIPQPDTAVELAAWLAARFSGRAVSAGGGTQ